MYIKKIIIENIRCFDEFTLEFESRRKSCLIVGDNGEGKSTLLRSIAISLCDVSSAAALFRELRGKFVRQRSGDEPSYIELYLQDTFDGRMTYIIRTEFHPSKKKALELLRQKVCVKEGKNKPREINQDEFPWSKIFVVGYGAGGRALGTESIESYAAIDGVYTLFRYDEPLQNPELALRRIKDEGSKRGQKDVLSIFLELLRNVLNLGKKDEVYLTKRGIEVRGTWGRSQLETLGDGYKSTIIWILDLIGRRLQFRPTLDPKRMSGIVLLDEIEQHLHPRWQLNVMSLLREAFPKIQFIATTHSPLVISGCKDCKIRKIKSSEDETGNAYGWRAEDVYRYILDLVSSRHPEYKKEILNKYKRLCRNSMQRKLLKNELDELTELREELRSLPGTDPTALTIELNSLAEELKKYGKSK